MDSFPSFVSGCLSAEEPGSSRRPPRRVEGTTPRTLFLTVLLLPLLVPSADSCFSRGVDTRLQECSRGESPNTPSDTAPSQTGLDRSGVTLGFFLVFFISVVFCIKKMRQEVSFLKETWNEKNASVSFIDSLLPPERGFCMQLARGRGERFERRRSFGAQSSLEDGASVYCVRSMLLEYEHLWVSRAFRFRRRQVRRLGVSVLSLSLCALWFSRKFLTDIKRRKTGLAYLSVYAVTPTDYECVRS